MCMCKKLGVYNHAHVLVYGMSITYTSNVCECCQVIGCSSFLSKSRPLLLE